MQGYAVNRGGPEYVAAYLSVMRMSFDAGAVERKAIAMPWLLQRNPAGHPTGSHLQVLRRGEQVVGGMLMLADTVWLDGRERPALLPMGIHVHPDFRGRGLQMLKAAYSAMPEGVMLGVPNDLHFGIHTRLGAAISKSRRVRFGLYRAGTMLARRTPAAGILRPVADAASLAFSRAMGLMVPKPRRGERIEALDLFGAEFDDFWRAARQNHRFLSSRNAGRMEWRYKRSPFGTYDVDVLRRDGAIVGMVVCRVVDRDGRRIGQVSDILCVREDPRDYVMLLGAANHRFRAGKAEFGEFAFIANDALDAAGRRAGFWYPRDHRNLAAHGFGHDDKADVDRVIGDLHFLRGDHDEDY